MARSHKQLAAGQRRSLARIAQQLEDMAAQWGDVDLFNMESLSALADQARQAAADLNQGSD